MNQDQPAPQQAGGINCTVKDNPDGSFKLVFCTQPQGVYIGAVTVETTNLQVLPMMASTLQQVAQSKCSALQLAPAGALTALDRKRISGN
jgi:hypothetical protein